MSELNVYHHELRPDEYDEFYLKYEADKVIAEKDEELHHHKYKRCLAMARWCESEAYIHEHGSEYDEDLVAWFGKWHKRWLKLAIIDENVKLKTDYKEARDRLQTANLIKDEQLAATRHSKYKRCLAMARMCEERSARYDVLQERHDLDWGKEIEFYYRWYKRWLELAEKCKEAK